MRETSQLYNVSFTDAMSLMLSKATRTAGSVINADHYCMVHQTEFLDSYTNRCMHLLGVSCFRAIAGRTPVLCLREDRAGRVYYEWHTFMRCTRVKRWMRPRDET